MFNVMRAALLCLGLVISGGGFCCEERFGVAMSSTQNVELLSVKRICLDSNVDAVREAMCRKLTKQERAALFKDNPCGEFSSPDKKITLSYYAEELRDYHMFCGIGDPKSSFFVPVFFGDERNCCARKATLYDAACVAFLRGVVRTKTGLRYQGFHSPELQAVFEYTMLDRRKQGMVDDCFALDVLETIGLQRLWSITPKGTLLPKGYLRVSIGGMNLDGKPVSAVDPESVYYDNGSEFFQATARLKKEIPGDFISWPKSAL